MSESKSSEPCQAEACILQTCLSKNTYSPDKCDDQLRQMYTCCQRMYDDKEENGKESTACPMPGVIRRWLKNHPSS